MCHPTTTFCGVYLVNVASAELVFTLCIAIPELEKKLRYELNERFSIQNGQI